MAVDTGAAAAASRTLTRISACAERLARYMVWGGGALLMLAALVVTFDVIQRKISPYTGWNISGSDEISGYLFAIGTAWAFSFALLRRANVRVDALYLLMPRRVRAVLDVFGILMLSIFVFVVTWHAMQMFIHNASNWSKSITPLLTPLAIPQFFWMVGLVMFVLNLFLVLVRIALALATGDLLTVGTVAGARTQEEEFEEEMRSLHLERATLAAGAAGPHRETPKE
jgi:TRAP-type C4-dicarboxylate transport system permease small subunit